MKNLQNMKGSKSHKNLYEENFTGFDILYIGFYIHYLVHRRLKKCNAILNDLTF